MKRELVKASILVGVGAFVGFKIGCEWTDYVVAKFIRDTRGRNRRPF